jgi:ABC-type dipeptide/oligopeptide/nickel transport system permease subunit
VTIPVLLPTAAPTATRPAVTRRRGTRSPVVLPLAALGTLAVIALLAPLLAPHDPARQFDLIALQNTGPSMAHPLGTDPFARDVLSRTLHAARVSLSVGGLAALVAVTLGAAWGALAGSAGRRVDALMMRLVDVALGVPRLLLLLVIVALWGNLSPPALAAVVGAVSWFGTSRLVRAQVRAAHGRDFALAATALGASRARVLLRHVAPHALGTLAVAGSMIFGDVIALEAGLSYLGLGVRPPQASWGSMIMDGAPLMLDAPWTAAVAIACVIATVLAASTLGDALRDRFDPRTDRPT